MSKNDGATLDWLWEQLGIPGAASVGTLLDGDFGELVDQQFAKYLWFIRRSRAESFFYCENCGHSGVYRHGAGHGPRHGEDETCPACGDRGRARNIRLSRTKLYEDGFVTWWVRSRKSPQLLAALTFYVMRDYREREGSDMTDGALMPWQVQTDTMLYAVCAFDYDRGLARRWERANLWAGEGPFGPWVRRAACKSPAEAKLRQQAFWGHRSWCAYSRDNADNAMLGTRWGDILDMMDMPLWDVTDGYSASLDGITDIANITGQHRIEYLLKLGCQELAAQKMTGNLMDEGLINWRGKTAAAVLRIPQNEIRRARKAGVEIDLDYLRGYAKAVSYGIRPQPAQLSLIGRMFARRPSGPEEIWPDPLRARKAMKYILRQGYADALRDAMDYWRECRELGRDLSEDSVAFPADLHGTHRELTMRKKTMVSAETRAKIDRLLERYEARYTFLHGGILLRPARSAEEIAAEGEALHHCVGRYVDSYANGNTVICVMRRLGELDTPWRTVELTTDGRMVQCRGDHNDMRVPVTAELKAMLDEFWSEFERWRAETWSKKAA